jgi:hypothetical protein
VILGVVPVVVDDQAVIPVLGNVDAELGVVVRAELGLGVKGGNKCEHREENGQP